MLRTSLQVKGKKKNWEEAMAGERNQGQAKAMGKRGAAAVGFKFNADAPEFFPGSFARKPVYNCFYPFLPFLGGGGGGMGSGWIYVPDQRHVRLAAPASPAKACGHCDDALDVIQKIVKQVEFQFSDANLIASDFLLKIMNKDPQGYVPMTIISSWKKIKALGADNQMLIKALKTSSKLIVSEDGKKVRRKKLFTEGDKEDLMSRTVAVENLPEDSSHKSIEKILSAVGSLKNIRICHPRESNSTRPSKTDPILSNKLHAFVEFETSDQAENAAEKLNDERNRRKGFRVKTLLRRSPRSVIRSKLPEYDQFDLNSEDDQSPAREKESPKTERVDESQNGMKGTWGRGRAKLHSLVQNSNGCGVLSQTPPGAQPIGRGQRKNYVRQASSGPRNPDGTRGFAMGRGKRATPSMTTTDLAPIKL